MQNNLSKKLLMIIGDYSEDYEVMVPFQSLQICGYEVHAVSPGKKTGETIQTAVHDFRKGEQTYFEVPGHKFQLNYNFEDVNENDYAGLVIPGGRAPEFLRLNSRVIAICKNFIENNKPIAAVCHGPLILAATNMVKDRKMTAFYGIQPDIEIYGVKYSKEEEALCDGNLVTGQTWMSHVPWLKKFLKVLSEYKS